MSALKKLASDTAIYGLSHILPRIFNFLVLASYLTYRIPNTSDFGVFTEMYAYSALLIAVMTFRMDTAYFRYGSREKDGSGKAYANAFIICAVISFLVFINLTLFAGPIAKWLNFKTTEIKYFHWFAWILLFDALTTLVYSKFRLENRPFRFLFFRSANVGLTIFFVLFFLEFVPWAMPGIKVSLSSIFGVKKEFEYTFIANLLASLAIFLLMLPEFRKIKWTVDKELMKTMFVYAAPLVVVAAAGAINVFFSTPLQMTFLGGTLQENRQQAGIYAGISKLAIVLQLFTTAFNYAIEPFFFNNAAKENDKQIHGKVALAYTIVGCIVVLGTFGFLDVLLQLIGKNYRSEIAVVPILLVSFLILGLSYNFSVWYRLSDNTKYGAYIAVAASVVTIIANIILLPRIGVVGSAWASLLCFSFMTITSYIYGQKHYPLEYPVKRIVYYLVIVSLMLIIMYQLRSDLQKHKIALFLINAAIIVLFMNLVLSKEKELFNRKPKVSPKL